SPRCARDARPHSAIHFCHLRSENPRAMINLLVLSGISFGLCLVLTPLASALAQRYGLVDRPDGRRKMQARPIPVAGGIPIFIATVVALAVGAIWFEPWGEIVRTQGHDLLGLLLAAGTICAVGVADDFGALRGKHKLLGQLLAVGVVISFGLVVRTISVFDW